MLETTRQKIIQNNLSTFGVGGRELLVSRTQHFTVFRGFSFVFNAFAKFAGLVAAVKTIVSAVKISQWTAKTTHAIVTTTVAAAHTIHAAVATTRWTTKITLAAAEIISSVIAKVVAAFPTSPRIVKIISCATQIIFPTVNAVQ
jgi:hypothetical protein